MTDASRSDVTQLLGRLREGKDEAEEALFEEVYPQHWDWADVQRPRVSPAVSGPGHLDGLSRWRKFIRRHFRKW